VLPPYEAKGGKDWDRGTANAIYQNLTFIERYDPEYTLILSGDHIYKMDYSKMLEEHKKNGADCTIAVLEVPMEEASRFGILNTDENNKIVEFEEKPKCPKSNKASMGIYIFTTKVLKKYLIEDEANPNSSNDFGKNIIPNMLNDGCPMYTYAFQGYWKDVGTLTSLWEANMDLLGSSPAFDLYDRNFRIFYRHEAYPPHRIGEGSSIKNAMITEGCVINGTVENSVLANGVIVEKGAVVRDCVIMSDVRICAGAKLEYAIVDSNTVIGENSVVGESKENQKLLLVGAGLEFPANSKIEGGVMIDSANIKDYIA
jgi:glucose-1-phosphate adenylyltransferase